MCIRDRYNIKHILYIESTIQFLTAYSIWPSIIVETDAESKPAQSFCHLFQRPSLPIHNADLSEHLLKMQILYKR